MTSLNHTKIENYIIIASLKSETMGKLINRIPGLGLLISSLPCLALRTHVESLGNPCEINKHFQSLAGKLDIKRNSPSILYLATLISHKKGFETDFVKSKLTFPCRHWYVIKGFLAQRIIRIHHECEVGMEKYVPRITDWYHKACRVMTNGDDEGRIFLFHPHTSNGLFFLLTTKYFILHNIHLYSKQREQY